MDAKPQQKDNDAEPVLLFAWGRFRLNPWVPVFLVISLLIHTGFFWLFAVKYPEPSRNLPATARLVVLDAGDPTTLDVLRQIEDRVAALDESLRAESRMPDGIFKEIRFAPLYAGRNPRLKKQPPLGFDTELPTLFPSGLAQLPPVPLNPDAIMKSVSPPAEASKVPPVPKVTIEGEQELQNRDLASPIDWSEAGDRFMNADGGAALFYVGVDAAGIVKFCLISEGRESGAADYLDTLVRRLRFDPAPEAGMQWGWVDFRW